MTIFGREPVAITTAIRAVLLAGIAFGLNLSDVQLVAVMLAIETVLMLLARQSVVSNPQANALIKTAVSMPPNTTVEAVKTEQASKEEERP